MSKSYEMLVKDHSILFLYQLVGKYDSNITRQDEKMYN